MVDWKNIHRGFTEELQKEWEDKGFSNERVEKWIKDFRLTPNDANFAFWLENRDENFAESESETDLELLRKEFTSRGAELVDTQNEADQNWPDEEEEKIKNDLKVETETSLSFQEVRRKSSITDNETEENKKIEANSTGEEEVEKLKKENSELKDKIKQLLECEREEELPDNWNELLAKIDVKEEEERQDLEGKLEINKDIVIKLVTSNSEPTGILAVIVPALEKEEINKLLVDYKELLNKGKKAYEEAIESKEFTKEEENKLVEEKEEEKYEVKIEQIDNLISKWK